MGAGLRATTQRSWVVGDRAKGERAMSQASAGGGKRAEIERTLVQRSLQDDSFRQRLLDEPKAAVEQELGAQLPEGVEVRAVEETADTIYLVLPSASALGGQGGDLSDEALEAVSGGGPALTSVLGVFTCGGACGN
jgi:Nitrile hydratase, alpha chain